MKRFLIFAISIMAFIPSFSQDSKVKRPDSYNYHRGVEAIQKENSEVALEYLNKEINFNAGYLGPNPLASFIEICAEFLIDRDQEKLSTIWQAHPG